MIVAVEKETQLEAWLEENMPESGGNPNTVEEYSGTTSTVMNNVIDFDALITEVLEGNATATLSLSVMQDTTVAGIVINGGLLFGAVFFANPEDTAPAAGAAYYYIADRVEPVYGKIIFQGDWVSLGTTNCTLKIIHHPLPEN